MSYGTSTFLLLRTLNTMTKNRHFWAKNPWCLNPENRHIFTIFLAKNYGDYTFLSVREGTGQSVSLPQILNPLCVKAEN